MLCPGHRCAGGTYPLWGRLSGALGFAMATATSRTMKHDSWVGKMVIGGWAISIELYWKRLSKFQACLHLWGFDTFCSFSFLSCQPPAYSHSTVGLLWEPLGSPQPAFPPGVLETA